MWRAGAPCLCARRRAVSKSPSVLLAAVPPGPLGVPPHACLGQGQPGAPRHCSAEAAASPLSVAPTCCVAWAVPAGLSGWSRLTQTCSVGGHIPSLSVCICPLLGAFTWLCFAFCPELITIIDKRTSGIQIILSSPESRSANQEVHYR